jgi:ABC-2 type transport system ATP-binding protein
MNRDAILNISGLTKEYKDFLAVDNISFSIKPGEILGLLGPNGAGKTTTINMIINILTPTKGKIKILGRDISKKRSEISQRVNFAAVYAHLPSNLTVYENLYIFGLIYNVENLKERINSLIKEFELEKFIHTKSGLLSSGEYTRLNIAKAIINKPSLLLMDEPTASLDPSVADSIREMIIRYVRETKSAVLWTSHNMQEIEKVCDRVLFLSHGKILLEGDPKNLPEANGKKNLEELFISIAREPLNNFSENI